MEKGEWKGVIFLRRPKSKIPNSNNFPLASTKSYDFEIPAEFSENFIYYSGCLFHSQNSGPGMPCPASPVLPGPLTSHDKPHHHGPRPRCRRPTHPPAITTQLQSIVFPFRFTQQWARMSVIGPCNII